MRARKPPKKNKNAIKKRAAVVCARESRCRHRTHGRRAREAAGHCEACGLVAAQDASLHHHVRDAHQEEHFHKLGPLELGFGRHFFRRFHFGLFLSCSVFFLRGGGRGEKEGRRRRVQ